jgi:hypothetical protein
VIKPSVFSQSQAPNEDLQTGEAEMKKQILENQMADLVRALFHDHYWRYCDLTVPVCCLSYGDVLVQVDKSAIVREVS